MPEIRLPVFEGPLELLLQLIERDDLDITAVSLVSVTDQYLATIRTADGWDLRALADFIAIGAKLLYLKSKALLPRPPSEPLAEDLEEDAVGRELVDLLHEYRKFRPVADALAERQDAGLHAYPRAGGSIVPTGAGLHNVTLDMLRRLMLEALKRQASTAPPATIPRDPTVPLSERIADLRLRLNRGERLSFVRLVGGCRTRGDIVITFLAILELLKAGECDARQKGNWEDIEIVTTIPAIP